MARFNNVNPSYLKPFVCLRCRKSFKRPFESGVKERPCPDCGKPAYLYSEKFKPPKSEEDDAWEIVARLAEHGFRYHSLYCDVDSANRPNQSERKTIDYPTKLRDVDTWLTERGIRICDKS